MTDDPALSRRLRNVKHIILVLSGKGGVGKSSVSVQLALSLLNRTKDAKVGLLDIDLTGPSIPRMLGLEGRSVLQSTDGWVPVHTSFNHHHPSSDVQQSLKCMSIGFLLNDPKDSVVWRGPKKNAMIRQFLVDVCWGELDWLIIDTPPGTSDEHISLLEQLSPLLVHQSQATSPSEPRNLPSLSSVLVTTPQAVSLLDVSKEYDFTKKTGLRVLGLIENMSGFICPHCQQIQNIFGSGGGQSFCEKVSNSTHHLGDSQDQQHPSLRFLGKIPIDVQFMKLMDQATNPDQQPASEPSNPMHPPASSLNANSLLIDRYFDTMSSKVFAEICSLIVQSITGSSAI
ncbi:cytosolic Fe-S cluster assembly factor cfd1 [Puccinia graminis f. sp. tritici]|uniref:Cytosolic Fe-S cluster assembly factor cfd1 n=1 Tax=Puccinia graminis f. sp. tritici TaxID=56615 RepID=A0A5B0RTM0_PUCGR|nr:cytosolic Fe-S cluster assembly factor cfd1 [Puccinia graminis f. sp. tritici]